MSRSEIIASLVHVNKTTPEASKTYLNARKGVAPEQKYDFPHVSSFDYGWRLSDRIASYKVSSKIDSMGTLRVKTVTKSNVSHLAPSLWTESNNTSNILSRKWCSEAATRFVLNYCKAMFLQINSEFKF